MKLHIVMHESFEAPGAIVDWANSNNSPVSYTRLYNGDNFPTNTDNFDYLIVMGGPQSPDTTTEECPHFDAQKEIDFIKKAIENNKYLLGVCLGAQLIGEALGAKFDHSPNREIGVFDLTLTDDGKIDPIIGKFGEKFSVGHWHGDMSERVMRIIKSMAPRVEVYSIDEIFLDLSTLKFIDLVEFSVRLRTEVMQQTGIPVSIGIAPTKTLAKMANKLVKKYKREKGVMKVETNEEIQELLSATAIGDVWGIGGQYEKLLLSNGVNTALEFAQLNEEWIRKNMTVVGQRMWNEMHGIPCIKWDEEPKPKKGICTSKSFGQLITKKKDLEEAIASHTATCAKKLRQDKSCANEMQVFIQTNPFRPEDKQLYGSINLRLRVASSNTAELIKYAIRGLNHIFQDGYNYVKAGIMVSDIVPEWVTQLSLFDAPPRAKDKALMKSMDQINHSFGNNKVRMATQGYNHNWDLRRQHLSKKYTTDLNELLTIKI